MRVRRAEAADAAAISLVTVRSWQAAYRGLMPQDYLDGLDPDGRREAWERRLADGRARSVTLVAEGGQGIVGFAHIGPGRDDDAGAGVGQVAAIYALSTVWGTGVGRALMDESLKCLAEAGFTEAVLWVLDTNARARRFYEAAGWRPDGAVQVDLTFGFPLSEVRYRRPLSVPIA